MPIRRLSIAFAALALFGSSALAQISPPGGGIAPPGGAITPPGGAISPPAGTISPPGQMTIPPPAVGNPNLLNQDPSGPLMPVRANTVMTTNALLGFVNDEPIFTTDVFRPIDADLRRLAASAKTIADFRRAAGVLINSQIDTRITESLFFAAAQAQLTDQDRNIIDVNLALERSKLIADHGGSAPAADRYLAESKGSNVDKEMADRRRTLVTEIYLRKNVVPRVVITRQMVLDAYDRDPKRWEKVAQVEMFTISLPITRWLREPGSGGRLGNIIANPSPEQIGAAERQALATAFEITAKLRAGADFARLVEDYESNDPSRSKGGRAVLTRGALKNTEFEDYVFSLPANTLGEPKLVRQPDFRDTNVLIVKIGNKVEAHTLTFLEVQAEISQQLRMDQIRDLRSKELLKLGKGAAVEAVDRMRGVALDAAVTRYTMN